jgi:hypothetical protein
MTRAIPALYYTKTLQQASLHKLADSPLHRALADVHALRDNRGSRKRKIPFLPPVHVQLSKTTTSTASSSSQRFAFGPELWGLPSQTSLPT